MASRGHTVHLEKVTSRNDDNELTSVYSNESAKRIALKFGIYHM